MPIPSVKTRPPKFDFKETKKRPESKRGILMHPSSHSGLWIPHSSRLSPKRWNLISIELVAQFGHQSASQWIGVTGIVALLEGRTLVGEWG